MAGGRTIFLPPNYYPPPKNFQAFLRKKQTLSTRLCQNHQPWRESFLATKAPSKIQRRIKFLGFRLFLVGRASPKPGCP
jgi:hypothetical protein